MKIKFKVKLKVVLKPLNVLATVLAFLKFDVNVFINLSEFNIIKSALNDL